MQKQPLFKRKQLVIAVSMAMLGGALTGCSSSSDSPAPPGTSTIVSNGGVGGSEEYYSFGGQGGSILGQNTGGSGGIQVLKTGKANTDFTTPGQITANAAQVDLGDNPLEVIADLVLLVVGYTSPVSDGGATTADEPYLGTDDVIRVAAGVTAVYASDPVLAAGTAYQRRNADDYRSIYLYDGTVTANDTKVTGISVAEGATLTLGDNSGCSSNVYVAKDISNDGTITRQDRDLNTCEIYLYVDKYIASGNIVNAGTDLVNNAGSVYVYATNGIANSGTIDASGYDNAAGNGGSGDYIQLDADGYVLNSGVLDASGGDGMGSGGAGRSVSLYGAYVENTAEIDVSGGDNTDAENTPGAGGQGGWFNMDGDYVTNNTASIDASGGDGSTGGGHGNSSSIRNSDVGEVKNAGDINLTGGMGSTGSGGNGGELNMYAYGGNVLNSGNLATTGGASADPAGNGGSGGDLNFDAYPADSGNAPTGDIVVSGNVEMSGGNAVADETGTGDGGWGGELDLNIDGAEAAQKIALQGYASIDLNGGDGAEGNDAGFVYLMTQYFQSPSTQLYTVGSLMNEVPVNARGGNSSLTDVTGTDGGEGGRGGALLLFADTSDEVKGLNSTATNTADIDVSGGMAVYIAESGYWSLDGGDGGEVGVRAYNAATNNGAVTANGGDGGEFGGRGGGLYVMSRAGHASNTGVVTANGGDGAETGGHGGYTAAFGATAANSGNADLNGGNATDPLSVYPLVMTYGFEYGGDGGEVYVSGIGLNAAASYTGTVSYTGGTATEGGVAGEDGSTTIGIECEGNCN